ncbi:unnamed protein product [Eruca vesicaria subsp. sativa]|uniref:Uncharacterized protein n=1 Tax=Eruca vesicaria subsp. sativa TaxID=29727 RepID=A0ABC8L8U5_ERUVS|nr:unnamed protein product [Eruca vesicaria subsp. sativa]
MANPTNLKLKEPVVEDYGSSLEEAFRRGKRETTTHHRAILYMCKEHTTALEEYYEARIRVEEIKAKLEILKTVEKVFGVIEEKQTLEAELLFAKKSLKAIHVPELNWFKLGEGWMYD